MKVMCLILLQGNNIQPTRRDFNIDGITVLKSKSGNHTEQKGERMKNSKKKTIKSMLAFMLVFLMVSQSIVPAFATGEPITEVTETEETEFVEEVETEAVQETETVEETEATEAETSTTAQGDSGLVVDDGGVYGETEEEEYVDPEEPSDVVVSTYAALPVETDIIKGIKIFDMTGATGTDPGVEVSLTNPVKLNARIRVEIEWEVANSVTYADGDTYSFQLPDTIGLYMGPAGYTGNLANGYGTYKIMPDGTVTLTFSAAAVAADTPTSKISLTTYFNEANVKAYETSLGAVITSLPFEIHASKIIHVPMTILPVVTGTQAWITKKGAVNASYNPTDVTWEMDVNLGGNEIAGPIYIQETLPAGLDAAATTVTATELELKLDGNHTVGSPVAVTWNAGTQRIEFPTGASQKAYRVTLVTPIESGAKLGTKNFNNSITLMSDTTPLGTVSSGNVQARFGSPITKTGSYSSTTGKITWSIDYNTNQENLSPADATIIDTLTSTMQNQAAETILPPTAVFDTASVVVNELTIDPGTGSVTVGSPVSVSPAFSAGNTVMTLPLSSVPTNKAYRITYTTTPIANLRDGESLRVNNEAEDGRTQKANANATATGGTVRKSSPSNFDYNAKEMTWTININAEKVQLGSMMLGDFLGTDPQLTLKSGSIVVTNMDTNTPMTLGIDYQIYTTQAAAAAAVASGTPAGQQGTFFTQIDGRDADFYIKFLAPSFTNTIRVQYVTTYPANFVPTPQTRFTNTLRSMFEYQGPGAGGNGWRVSNGTNGANPPAQITLNGNKTGTYDVNTKEITWRVNANFNGNTILGGIITDDISDLGTFIPSSVKVRSFAVNPNGTVGTLSSDFTEGTEYTFNETAGNITLTMSSSIVGGLTSATMPIQLEFKTSLANHLIKASSNYKNEAELEINGQTNQVSVTPSITQGGVYAVKKGKGVQGVSGDATQVKWGIDINPSLSTINNFILTDTMEPTEQVYNADSLKIYPSSNAGVVDTTSPLDLGTDYNVTYVNGVLEITFLSQISSRYYAEYTTTLTDLMGDGEILVNKIVGTGTAPDGESITSKMTVPEDDTIILKLSSVNSFPDAPGRKGELTVTKTDMAGNTIAVAGTTFELYVGALLVATLSTDATGTVTFPNVKSGTYTLKETSAPAGYLISPALYVGVPITIDNSTGGVLQSDGITTLVTTEYEAKNPQSTVSVKKTKADGLTGITATFDVYVKDGAIVPGYAGLVTDAAGNLTITGLPLGEYTLKEAVATTGYLKNTQGIDFKIETNAVTGVQTAVNIVFRNYQGSVKLTKTGDGGMLLAGTTFQLKRAGVDVGAPVTTNGIGEISFTDLEPGNYTLVETAAAPGYVLDTTPQAFTIPNEVDGSNPVAVAALDKELTMSNNLTSVEITKTDVAGNPLVATFEVKNGAVTVQTVTTNASTGKVVVVGLVAGTYQVSESVVPTGYVGTTEVRTLTIAADGTATGDMTFKNYQGSVEFTKTGDAGVKLPGATFKLVKDGVDLQTGLITDIDGEIIVTGLAPGAYEFIETAAPAGYVLDTTPVTFTIPATVDGASAAAVAALDVQVSSSNDLTVITIDKTDAITGVPLEATFEVKDSTNTVVQTVTTDATGEVIVYGLIPGTYTVEETVASAGYILNTAKQTVTFDADGNADTGVLYFVNYQADVEFVKTDEKGVALAGATFKLEKDGLELSSGLVTDSAGKIVINQLAPGNYEFIETAAPAGYKLDTTPVAFNVPATVDGDDTAALAALSFKVTKGNELTAFSIKKVDAVTGAPLVATFEVIDASGAVATSVDGRKATIATGTTGTALIEGLVPGTYTVTERVAADGYIRNTETQTITINSAGNVDKEVVEFKNYKGSVELSITDKDGNPVAGGTYTLYKADGTKVAEKLVADRNGNIVVEGLAPGAYYFVETRKAAGYEEYKNRISFTIAASAEGEPEVVEVSITVEKAAVGDTNRNNNANNNNNNNNNNGNRNNNNPAAKATTLGAKVDTGDTNVVGIFTATALLSLALAAVIVIKKKRRV